MIASPKQIHTNSINFSAFMGKAFDQGFSVEAIKHLQMKTDGDAAEQSMEMTTLEWKKWILGRVIQVD